MLIALSGWKQSGKDTVADYLCSEYGFHRISFASRLKDMVAEQYNIPREFLDSPSHKEMPLLQYPVIPSDKSTQRLQEMFHMELRNGFWTPRALCILEGSTKRAVHSNYWVRIALRETLENPGNRYVITDMRYKTEADTVRLLHPHMTTLRINRFDSSPTEDPSERDMDDYRFDYVISNRTTKEDLYNEMDILLSRITGIR